MNFLSRLFGWSDPISDRDTLKAFISTNAAFVAQKGIYEYARARAGHYSKVLFSEKGFQRAVEEARWRAYPLGLAMVAEVATVVLQETTKLDRQIVLRSVSEMTLSAFDQWEVPAELGEPAWRQLRSDLAVWLDRIGLHPPKRAMDIPEPFAKDYFALMPIHESLRGQDFPTLKNYLIVTLCNVHHELSKRLDGPSISIALDA